MRAPQPPLVRPERIFAGYAFDLDGTIYLGDALLPGSARLLTALRDLHRPVVFVSNNPTRTAADYARRLTALGIPAGEADVVGTVTTTVEWVVTACPGARVFAIAEPPLLGALRDAGVELCEDPERIDLVIASFDRTLEYRKLQIAFDVLWRRPGTRLVATNPDPYCPTPRGGEPDAAGVIAALEACTGRRCERHFGKPGREMMDAVMGRLGAPPADCVMVGDRLSTDLAGAAVAGMRGAVVLTGETGEPELSALAPGRQPDYVLERIDHLLPEGEWTRRGWGAVSR